MGHESRQPQKRSTVPDMSTVFVIMGTIGETTWRMFTPVITLLVLGLWLDHKTGHKPWFSLGGVLIGFALAIALVALQYNKTKDIYKDTDTKQ